MPIVVGIRFKDSGKMYYFDPNGLDELHQGESVIVETVRGPELAKVAYPPREIDQSEVVGELKPVLRRAEPNDFERLKTFNARQNDLLVRCAEKIREHDLPMRLVKAEYSFDGSRLTFYFTAEKRVDFRNLVRDLARTFRTRIELRQIGPRDEAKLLGGIGPCGRLLCCATFLPDYARVSIKMAKDQDLPLNPTKISGVCGRLLCCLSYEHEQYLSIKAELPRKGAWVKTPDGPGEVVVVNVVRETVTVELHGSGMQVEFSPAQIQETTRQVADLARSRTAEGITPLFNELRETPTKRPPREPKRSGERRLLRDEIDDPEVLDALSFLEEGLDGWDEPPGESPPVEIHHTRSAEQRPDAPPRPPRDDQARPAERTADGSAVRRRPPHSGGSSQSHQQRNDAGGLPPAPSPGPAGEHSSDSAEDQPSRESRRPPRRRRRGGGRQPT